jgi:hypothetical protein
MLMDWPNGKSFAFSIFDDTDNATVDNVSDVYRFLGDLGLKTTKSIWPSRPANGLPSAGNTCEDQEYVGWLLDLRKKGFEIGYHMNACRTSTREETRRGLDSFEQLFGGPPRTMASHSGCRENMYWGPSRLTGFNRLVYNVATGFRNKGHYRGQIEGDPLFWGDICRDRITYCRSFVFPEINTLKVCPFMPYHDPNRPYVNYWFASSEGPTVDSFNHLLSEANQNRLEEERGCCIVYTHFASGFYAGRSLNIRFRQLMEKLAARPGWLVPVSTVLDYLIERKGRHVLTNRQRRYLEWKWLRHKFRVGTT